MPRRWCSDAVACVIVVFCGLYQNSGRVGASRSLRRGSAQFCRCLAIFVACTLEWLELWSRWEAVLSRMREYVRRYVRGSCQEMGL